MHIALIVAIAIALTALPNIGGFLFGFLVVRQNLDPWFSGLHKPALNPPNWLFAPAWTIIYCSIGIASFLVWLGPYRSGFVKVSRRAVAAAWAVYVVQLALNWAWTPVFFGRHDLLGALVVIGVLDVVAALNAAVFGRISWVAGLLFVPYLLWLAYATYLNAALWRLNG